MANAFADTANSILDELRGALGRVDDDDAKALARAIADSPRLFVAGAGRSGLLLRCAAMRLMHLGKTVHVVGDTLTPSLAAGDLLLVASGSGETGGLVAVAAKARDLGARIAVVTANPASRLAALADILTPIDAPTPKAPVAGAAPSVQPMGSLFEQAMFLLLESLALELMRQANITSAEMFARHANLE